MTHAPAPLNTILAATDLKDGSEPVLKSAGLLAARTGANLHVLHVMEPERRFSLAGEGEGNAESRLKHAGNLLEGLVRRAVPEGVVVKSMKVEERRAVHSTILHRAEDVTADLIVLGPQSGGNARSHFLGTTADRVLLMTGIPCLVVDEVIADPIERIGVPVDFSMPSGVALLAALSMGTHLSSAGDDEAVTMPRLQVMHVGWTVERADNPDLEEQELKPRLKQQLERALHRHPEAESLDIDVSVRWGYDPAAEITGWVLGEDIDLLVMGTHGRTGFRRALLGSIATRIARRMPCPVLLVPPSYRGGWTREPAMDRVLITTDFHDTDLETARWCVDSLAPSARHVILHALDVPDSPVTASDGEQWRTDLIESSREEVTGRLEEIGKMMGGQISDSAGSVDTMTVEGRPADEIVRTAAESDMDLIVMGGYRQDERNQSGRAIPSTTVERVLRATSTPVLIVRAHPDRPPQNVLVAVDGSEPSLRALAWADFMRRHFGSSCTAFFVESPALFEYSDTLTHSVDVSDTDEPTTHDQNDQRTAGWAPQAARTIRKWIGRAGFDPDDFGLRVAAGRPAEEILVEQERSGADLVVIGTHGRGTGLQSLLGSVAGAVVREASSSVLAVGDPARAGG